MSRYFERKVRDLTKHWQDTMGLGWLSVSTLFEEEPNPKCPDMVAETTTYWEYRDTHTTWFKPRAMQLTTPMIEGVIVHELVHAITAPLEVHLRPGYAEQREFAVESLARAIMHAAGVRHE